MPRISQISEGNLHFLILDCPSDATLPDYLPILEEHNVSDLVRICDGSPYQVEPLAKIGAEVHDNMKFPDGTAPSKTIIDTWLDLNNKVFFDSEGTDRHIAVHCVSGIGRAPVLVAISLIEGGMDFSDAVAKIRAVRRGALNKTQINFLESYKRQKRLGKNSSSKSGASGSGEQKKKTGFISKLLGKK